MHPGFADPQGVSREVTGDQGEGRLRDGDRQLGYGSPAAGVKTTSRPLGSSMSRSSPSAVLPHSEIGEHRSGIDRLTVL